MKLTLISSARARPETYENEKKKLQLKISKSPKFQLFFCSNKKRGSGIDRGFRLKVLIYETTYCAGGFVIPFITSVTLVKLYKSPQQSNQKTALLAL